MGTCKRQPYKKLSSKWVYCNPDDVPGCPAGFSPDKKFGKDGLESNSAWKITGKLGNYCFGDLAAKVPRWRRHCVKTQWDPKDKVACCLGKENSDEKCSPEWCSNSKACDDVFLDYCSKPENYNLPICGCSLPASQYKETNLFGPPECVDKRCANNPAAHRLDFQKNPTCNITNCVIGDFNANAKEKSNIDVSLIQQNCGPKFTDLRGIETPEAVAAAKEYEEKKQKLKSNPVNYLLFGLVGVSFVSSFLLK